MQLSYFGLALTSARCVCNTNTDLVGTLRYIAPEYLLDSKSLIKKLDLILSFSDCSHVCIIIEIKYYSKD
jgi:hypothetical protein